VKNPYFSRARARTLIGLAAGCHGSLAIEWLPFSSRPDKEFDVEFISRYQKTK